MKRILSFAVFSLFLLNANAQSLPSPNDPAYQAQKALLVNHSSVTNPKLSDHKVQSASSNFNCNCLLPLDTTFHIVPFSFSAAPFYRNDDGSYAITLPFSFNFYGTPHNRVFINNNGNVTVDTAYYSFSSSSFPTNVAKMIAPFWADVDTRGGLSGVSYYKVTPHALIVKWDSVGYYNAHDDKGNTFQFIMSDGLDSTLIPGGNNVSFCYGDMQWTTGDASAGANGFMTSATVGYPATVGINKGDSVNFFQVGRFGAPGYGYNGGYGANDSIDALDNLHLVFNTMGATNLQPFSASNVCDTTVLMPMQLVTGTVTVYAPEYTQTVTATGNSVYKTATDPFSITGTQPITGGMQVFYEFNGALATGGLHAVKISGHDNGPGALTYSKMLYFRVPLVTGIEGQAIGINDIYPNPASDRFSVQLEKEGIHTLEVYDIYGKKILSSKIDQSNGTVSIESISAGYYMVKILSPEGRLLLTRKLIIEK